MTHLVATPKELQVPHYRETYSRMAEGGKRAFGVSIGHEVESRGWLAAKREL